MVTLGEAFTKHDVLWAVKPSTQLGFRADLNINDIGETHDSPVKLGFILYSVQYIYIYMYVHKLHCITLHYHYHFHYIAYIYICTCVQNMALHYSTLHYIIQLHYYITLRYITLHTLHYIHYIHIYTHTYIIYIAQPRKTQKTLTHIYIYKYTNTI